MSFLGEVEVGHKGCAVLVPFDPARAWGAEPVPVASTTYGKAMPGVPVRGSIGGVAFEGWIGERWGRRFVLLPDTLLRAAGLHAGDTAKISLRPRPPRARGEVGDAAAIPANRTRVAGR